VRTDSENIDFQQLVAELDKDLAIRNGEANDFFAQFNKIDQIKNVVVVFENEQAVACGAMKEFDESTMEIKRMFVPMDKRGRGLASLVLLELEKWAIELGYAKLVLETGDKMPEAIGLYHKSNFKIIANYGQYSNVASSICFEKKIDALS
jgi:GNAT superfamily N-acetyltransferase